MRLSNGLKKCNNYFLNQLVLSLEFFKRLLNIHLIKIIKKILLLKLICNPYQKMIKLLQKKFFNKSKKKFRLKNKF